MLAEARGRGTTARSPRAGPRGAGRREPRGAAPCCYARQRLAGAVAPARSSRPRRGGNRGADAGGHLRERREMQGRGGRRRGRESGHGLDAGMAPYRGTSLKQSGSVLISYCRGVVC
jgi:hypothetical protein